MAFIRVHPFHLAFDINLRDYPNTGAGFASRCRAAVAYLAEHLPRTLVRLDYDSAAHVIHVILLAENTAATPSTAPLNAVVARWRTEVGRFLESLPAEEPPTLPSIPAVPAEGGA